MTLQEIIDLTLERLELTDDDDVEKIIISAINEGYMKLNKVNPQVITSYIPIINKVATMPENLVELIECTPELTAEDKIIGNNIITDKQGTFEIIYTGLFDTLEELDSEPEIPSFLHSLLSSYACYKFTQNKNPNISQAYLTEFEMSKSDYKDMVKKDIGTISTIQNYYDEFNLVGEW